MLCRIRKHSSPIAFGVIKYSCEIEQRDRHGLEKNDLIMNLAHLCCQLASLLKKMLEKVFPYKVILFIIKFCTN